MRLRGEKVATLCEKLQLIIVRLMLRVRTIRDRLDRTADAHGPQLASSVSRSKTSTVPSPSKSGGPPGSVPQAAMSCW